MTQSRILIPLPRNSKKFLEKGLKIQCWSAVTINHFRKWTAKFTRQQRLKKLAMMPNQQKLQISLATVGIFRGPLLLHGQSRELKDIYCGLRQSAEIQEALTKNQMLIWISCLRKQELLKSQLKKRLPNSMNITRYLASQKKKNDKRYSGDFLCIYSHSRAKQRLIQNNLEILNYLSFFWIANIRLLSNKIRMLPSMRYETKKLAELYHMKKSFRDHKRSIEKIKNKPNDTQIQRSKDINQLRNRMHYAFNYTQYVRGQEITKDNLILFKKCTDDRRTSISIRSNPKKLQSSLNLSNLGQRSERKYAKQVDNHESEAKSPREQYLLRNHRSSPINKMTNYERSKENLRLAIKIAKPCPAINTKKLEQIHEEAKRHRQRIMRYDSVSLKSTKYLDKKLSNNSFRSHRVSSSLSEQKSIKNSPKKLDQVPKNIKPVNQMVHNSPPPQKKLNRTAIFRNKHNDNQFGFSLTEYQP